MKTNIALIGFMGTGKTTVGRILAEKLGKRFIELDWLIELRAGKSIPDIFRDGETAFRELEIAVTKDVAHEKDAVIACGGGIILNQINVARLRESAVIVYLTASPQTILKRVAGEPGRRPLLSEKDQAARIKELLSFRKRLYESAADIKISTTRLSAEAVADRVIAELKEHDSSDKQE